MAAPSPGSHAYRWRLQPSSGMVTFPTRPTPSPRSCVCQPVLWPSVTWPTSSPGTHWRCYRRAQTGPSPGSHVTQWVPWPSLACPTPIWFLCQWLLEPCAVCPATDLAHTHVNMCRSLAYRGIAHTLSWLLCIPVVVVAWSNWA